MGGRTPPAVSHPSATEPAVAAETLKSDSARQRDFLRANGWWLWTIAWSVIAIAYLGVHDPLQSSALYDAFAIGAVVAIVISLRTRHPRDPAAWALVGTG